MTVKLLTEQNLEFLSITGGCTGSSGKQRSDVLLGSDLDLNCLQSLSAATLVDTTTFYLVLVQPIPT